MIVSGKAFILGTSIHPPLFEGRGQGHPSFMCEEDGRYIHRPGRGNRRPQARATNRSDRNTVDARPTDRAVHATQPVKDRPTMAEGDANAQPTTAEQVRLEETRDRGVGWKQWGPYLSERQWGTVREDYSQNGDAWNYFPFEEAHFRSYIWGEDGLAGISDYYQNLCFAIALWNGKDKILKERLFGLGNSYGNHGEDVKELYYYMDNIP